MLYAVPALTRADQRVLDDVEARRTRLRHQLQSHPGKWTRGLRRNLTARAIAGSNAIEGYAVSVATVEDLLAGEKDVEISDENKAETTAYQHAMTYIQSLADAPAFTYERSLLNGLHWMLQGHHYPKKLAGLSSRLSAGPTCG